MLLIQNMALYYNALLWPMWFCFLLVDSVQENFQGFCVGMNITPERHEQHCFFFFITPSRFSGILYTCKYSCCPKMGWNWEISDRSFSLCWKYQQHQSNRLFDGNEDQNTMSILPQPFNSNFSNEIIYFSHRFFLFIDFTLWRFGSCTSFASQLSI